MIQERNEVDGEEVGGEGGEEVDGGKGCKKDTIGKVGEEVEVKP